MPIYMYNPVISLGISPSKMSTYALPKKYTRKFIIRITKN